MGADESGWVWEGKEGKEMGWVWEGKGGEELTGFGWQRVFAVCSDRRRDEGRGGSVLRSAAVCSHLR